MQPVLLPGLLRCEVSEELYQLSQSNTEPEPALQELDDRLGIDLAQRHDVLPLWSRSSTAVFTNAQPVIVLRRHGLALRGRWSVCSLLLGLRVLTRCLLVANKSSQTFVTALVSGLAVAGIYSKLKPYSYDGMAELASAAAIFLVLRCVRRRS